jgi:nitrogen-specific signal transduction histidine kinase
MTELQDKATLVASELVGNAVLHAKTSIELRIQPTGGLLRIEVRDTSPRLPLRRMFSAEATTGRGLSLVDRLSEHWGVIPASDGRGKTVWAVIGPADEEEDETEQFFGGRWDVDLDDVTGHAPDAAPAVPANRSTVPAA